MVNSRGRVDQVVLQENGRKDLHQHDLHITTPHTRYRKKLLFCSQHSDLMPLRSMPVDYHES
jgi:hypothetical protein